MNSETLYFVIAIVLALVFIHGVHTFRKIQRAREKGKKLYRKNHYYSLLFKLFGKNLPD